MPDETVRPMTPTSGECKVVFLITYRTWIVELLFFLFLSFYFPSFTRGRPQSESSSESRSRSRSPGTEKITFITSFGGSDEEGAAAAQAPPTAQSTHAPSNPAGHSRGSRSVTSLYCFPLAFCWMFSPVSFMCVAL